MLTKKTKIPKTNTTRKLPPFEKLPKTRRSRILSMETYKINYLHNPFRKMILSYDKPVVAKVYDANKLDLLLERKILEKMRDYRNVVRLICDDNKNNYITRGTDKLYFFVYEYIAHGNISDYLQKTRDIEIVKTLILQMVCVIIELAEIYKVCHGNLNSVNILIDTTDEKTLEYRIGDEIVTIESNGIIPKIIDFGRSKFYKEPINNQHVWYDIIMVITLINTHAKNYEVDLVIKNQDPYELSLPSIKDYYFYVRDAIVANKSISQHNVYRCKQTYQES